MKKLFKNESGDFHFGTNCIDGFSESEEKVDEILKSRPRLWRCFVCDDLYVGEIPPEKCPTCFAIEAYAEINENEFKERMK